MPMIPAGSPVAASPAGSAASPSHCEAWVAEHPGTFLLTLGDAHELAARVNHRMFPRTIAQPTG